MFTRTHLMDGPSQPLSTCGFDEQAVLAELKHHLPSQSALKDFIHHNTLHAFQHLRFYEAIFQASSIFGYQPTLQLGEFRQLYKIGRIRDDAIERVLAQQKGVNTKDWKDRMLNRACDENRNPKIGRLREKWKSCFGLDLDTAVQPLLFRILCAWLDQGIAGWKFPLHEDGFLAAIRALEQNGLTSFFKTRSVRALLFDDQVGIRELLELVVGDEAYWRQYLFDQQFSHQGWSGFVCSLEDLPQGLLDRRTTTLSDLIQFELLLELDQLEYLFGQGRQPLCSRVKEPPLDLFQPQPLSELQELLSLWQEAFEWSYYNEVLCGLMAASPSGQKAGALPSFQAIFCIDERECSIRRHLEHADPDCETFGAPGFFGAEFFFLPENGKFFDKLCPAPVTPKFLVREIPAGHQREHDLLYTPLTKGLVGGFVTSLTLGFAAAGRFWMNLFRPRMSPAISNAFAHMNDHAGLHIENRSPEDRQQDLQVGFSISEMAARVEGQLRNMGLVERFSRLIYVMAHGSSSANNPHHGAHDCGACSGRPGSVNSRTFALMANHPEVRKVLAGRGIAIPDSTHFLGGLHDTAADENGYFDEHLLTPDNRVLHQANKAVFEKALDRNAKERSRRFSSIGTRQPLRRIRQAIKDRSVSLFEPRPELGHGTNSLCFVGRRQMTRNLFLDRRAFLNSYDWQTDPEGKLLLGVMRPLGVVCGGINLEYYFSRVDNCRLGAGTKLPHNVMGLFGVANSSDGDLRPGLPVQMIEVHDPVRLMIIVEHFPEVVLRTIQSDPALYEWFENEWIHLIAVHPKSRSFFRFQDGEFRVWQPLVQTIQPMPDFDRLVENSLKMPSNQTSDATRENLPVFILEK